MPPIAAPTAAEARAFLASSALFAGLAAAELDAVAAELEWQMVPGGACVFRQGEAGHAMHLVASGRLVVVRTRSDSSETVVAQKGRGDTFGELAVLTGRPRSATVRALRDSVIASLSKARVDRVLRRNPEVLWALTRLLASLLEREAPPPAGGCVAIALTAASGVDSGVDLTALAEALAGSLAKLAPTLLLDSRRVDERFGAGTAACEDGTAAHGKLAAWLDEQETRYAVKLFVADAGPTGWTRRSLRQADHIVVIADANAPATLGPLAEELAALERDQGRQLIHLVLLQAPDAVRPRRTADWLRLRPFRGHHHLRRGNSADVDRITRSLLGRAVGLVLGGGGARGFAHIGVIHALEEAGIPVDRIGGTSMGAILAAQYAENRDWRPLIELSRRGWLEIAPQKVYTLPLISLLSMVKGERMLAMWFRDVCIEDLWLPYFCVSTNLSRTELHEHTAGSLHEAVAASMTIPGLTAPRLLPGGDLLVDGGVLDNLPTDTMRRLGAGPIIASDVSAVNDLRAHPSYERTPSPWQLLRQRFGPRERRRPFPNILRLVNRSALLASDVYAKQHMREVELYLDLPMDDVDMLDMRPIESIVEHGYEFTRKKLAEDGVRAAVLGVGLATASATDARGS